MPEDRTRSERVFHFEGGVPVFDVSRVDKLELEAEAAKRRDEEYKKEQLHLNRLLMLFTGILALVGLIGSVISIYQAHVAKINADAANLNAVAAQGMLEQMKNSGTDTHALAVNAETQAEAAKDTATAAKGSLSLSSKALHLSERPYVTVEDVKFDPALDQAHDPAIIKIGFHNAGRSPALKATEQFNILVDGAVSASRPTDFPGEMTIASDRTNVTSLSLWLHAPGDFDHIVDGTRKLSLKGHILYTDIFKDWHQTFFCAIYDSKGKEWKFCPGNDVQ